MSLHSLAIAAAGTALLGLATVLTVQQNEPAAVATAQPASPSQASAPKFDVVRVNRQGHAVMAGRAAPGAAVIISDGAAELGRVVADERGEWVFLPETPLASGSRQLALRAERDGEPTVPSKMPLVIAVPERGANADALAVPAATADEAPRRPAPPPR